MNFVEPIRDAATVYKIGDYLKEVHIKYYVMFLVGIYSGLRISDILKLKIKDVRGKDKIRVKESKTGKTKAFPINPELGAALNEYCTGKEGDAYLIPSPRTSQPITRVYAHRVIHNAGLAFGLDNLGTHTMRKTFGFHLYNKTKDIGLLMRLFNHSSETQTLRYIGIEQTNIDEAILAFRYSESESEKN